MSQSLSQPLKPQQLSFSKPQQYTRIGYLGLCFMLMFTSFNSLQNMVSKLYEQYGYNNLGQSAILFIYFTFGISTLFTSFIIKHVGYKKTMFLSSLGYAVFQATGLLVVTDIDISKELVWVCINLGACVCGFSASVLWVAQGGYTSQVATGNTKNQLFGLFWALMMSSQIFGNLLSTFVLGRINNLVYFVILTILGVSSSLFFLFLPDVKSKSDNQQIEFKTQVKKVIAIIKDKKYKYINLYFFFPGLTVAFYAGFLYKLVKMSLPQEPSQQTDDYNKRINQHQGYVFITLGLSQILTGFLMNRFSQRFNKFKMAIFGTLIVQVASFVSFVCYYLKAYEVCFVASFFWGCAETFLQTNTGGLIATVFQGKVQGYSVYRIFFALGVVAVLMLNILLSGSDPYIFITIILALQTVVTAISLNLRNLQEQIKKNSSQSTLVNSLLTEENNNQKVKTAQS